MPYASSPTTPKSQIDSEALNSESAESEADQSRSNTIISAIKRLNLNLKNESDVFNFLIIGADNTGEGCNFNETEQIFKGVIKGIKDIDLNGFKKVKTVNFFLIGPNVDKKLDGKKFDIKHAKPTEESDGNVIPGSSSEFHNIDGIQKRFQTTIDFKFSFSYHRQCYEEFKTQLENQIESHQSTIISSNNTIAFLFNSGIWGYGEQWLKALHCLKDIPVISTAYSLDECESDEDVLKEYNENCITSSDSNSGDNINNLEAAAITKLLTKFYWYWEPEQNLTTNIGSKNTERQADYLVSDSELDHDDHESRSESDSKSKLSNGNILRDNAAWQCWVFKDTEVADIQNLNVTPKLQSISLMHRSRGKPALIQWSGLRSNSSSNAPMARVNTVPVAASQDQPVEDESGIESRSSINPVQTGSVAIDPRPRFSTRGKTPTVNLAPVKDSKTTFPGLGGGVAIQNRILTRPELPVPHESITGTNLPLSQSSNASHSSPLGSTQGSVTLAPAGQNKYPLKRNTPLIGMSGPSRVPVTVSQGSPGGILPGRVRHPNGPSLYPGRSILPVVPRKITSPTVMSPTGSTRSSSSGSRVPSPGPVQVQASTYPSGPLYSAYATGVPPPVTTPHMIHMEQPRLFLQPSMYQQRFLPYRRN